MTLPSKTEPVNTGESYVTLHLKATQAQIERFQASLEIENHLVNFANYYLEKTYGRKHLSRSYPAFHEQGRIMVADTILAKYIDETWQLDAWPVATAVLPLQAAKALMIKWVADFGVFREKLRLASRMTDREKRDFQNNANHDNPHHIAWHHQGALPDMSHGRKMSSIILDVQAQRIVTEAHQVKLPGYGTLSVEENINQLRTKHVKKVIIKRKNADCFTLQLTIVD